MRAVNVMEAPAVAPVALAAGEGAASLFTLLLWGIALALLLVWTHTIGAAFQWVADEMDKVSVSIFGRTRHLLGPVSSALRSADHAIQVALSETAHGAEHATVYLLSQAWHTLEWTAREIWRLGYGVGAALEGLVHDTIPRLVRVGVHGLEHELHAIGRRLAAAEVAVARPLTRSLHRMEAALERDFGIARRGIDATRRDLARAEKATARLGSRVKSLEGKLGVAAFAGLVAVALGRLGLGFLRCPSFLRLGRRLGCGGFSLLEDVLFGVVEVFALTDLCRFAGLVTSTAEEIRPLLIDFVNVEEALVGCHGATRPPALGLPRLQLPPSNAGLPLAA